MANPSEMPAWLQAGAAVLQLVAAVVGIRVAYQIGFSQQQAQRQTSEESRHRLLAGVRATASMGTTLIESLCAGITGDEMSLEVFQKYYRPEDFEAALRAIRMIPLHEIGDLVLVTFILKLEAILDRLRHDLDQRSLACKRDVVKIVRGLNFLHERHTDVWNAAASISRQITVLGVPEMPGEGRNFG